jgi:hypothetical protein
LEAVKEHFTLAGESWEEIEDYCRMMIKIFLIGMSKMIKKPESKTVDVIMQLFKAHYKILDDSWKQLEPSI